jgi:hypothetical protein
MIRVDAYYLFQIGSRIHPLSDLRAQATSLGAATTFEEARFPIYIAEAALDELIHRSIFRLKTSFQSGQALLTAIRSVKTAIDDASDTAQLLGWAKVYEITAALTTFEAVLGAELSLWPVYLVTPKAGFDIGILIETGNACFPLELANKAPQAISDIKSGTRCMAFELFTAAAFHLHRANESVLHVYWDVVTGGAPRPTGRNMGDYLREMDRLVVGDDRVKAALKDLKDLHRNPLIHPEHSIENADEAIALMNSVHTAIFHMLQAIPAPPVPVTLAGGVATSLLDAVAPTSQSS